MDLKGRSFLTLLDFNKEEIRYMLDLAHELKAKKKKGILGEELKGKNIVLVFDKSSTISCPNPRYSIASYILPKTLAVSSINSFLFI